ncbi:hypothetical protein GCM10025857_24260 [Alicyclobacillus contaminans]|uniref:polysaccharide deacetylase family protein n=1 Tax=Alicyclobacillus contaminans TaxID=392016 RepID=UPI00040AEFC7|nr:polysaccharide deacetylase family protein [Alicyclobacillus contaminans]GMA51069.1 hypothetical protein GCM10025857_24260 [Alicyclobacillus contaminans]
MGRRSRSEHIGGLRYFRRGRLFGKLCLCAIAASSVVGLVGAAPASAAETRYVVSANLSQQFPGIVFYTGRPSAKNVALTFDDGPDAKYTPQVLDILRRYHVKATFFVLGVRAKRYPQTVRRMVREGHAIGNHTWNHPDLAKMSASEIRDQIVRTDCVLSPLIGYRTNLLRPPYGALNPDTVRVVSAMGYKVVDWSVDTRDWAGTPVPAMLAMVRKDVRPGAIILEHCGGKADVNLDNTLQALPKIIEYLRSQGYRLVTIPELIGTSR